MSLLEAHDLEFSFGRDRALAGLSLGVEAGEVVAVTGTSGSGKSTLLHCLAAILRPASGEVRLDGRRIDDRSERERSLLRRRDFGFVFQFGELIPELSIGENVALPLRLAGQRRRDAAVAATAMLDRFGIAGLAGQRPSQTSGGQAQRAAVARALVRRPKVVFADEPTGALDSENGALVLAALIEAAKEQGAAVVIVTHEVSVAARADRVIRMANGVLVADSDVPAGTGAA
jgi:putative ABC transport system ATP-binding protein